MLGAIIGDIVGSRFEWHPTKSTKFELFTNKCFFTDDTVMTCAIAQALLEWDNKNYESLKNLTIKNMQLLGRKYPNAGYGGNFSHWIYSPNPKPYFSFGNGSAMRVSPVAWAATSLEQAIKLAEVVTKITHNHPDGIAGAKATAAAIYLARNGKSKEYIRPYISKNFYKLDFKLDWIRIDYSFEISCAKTVPQAIVCFLEANNYEETIRNAISLGGDADTLAAIAGSIAQAYYGIDDELRDKGISYLDKYLKDILDRFENKFMNQK